MGDHRSSLVLFRLLTFEHVGMERGGDQVLECSRGVRQVNTALFVSLCQNRPLACIWTSLTQAIPTCKAFFLTVSSFRCMAAAAMSCWDECPQGT